MIWRIGKQKAPVLPRNYFETKPVLPRNKTNFTLKQKQFYLENKPILPWNKISFTLKQNETKPVLIDTLPICLFTYHILFVYMPLPVCRFNPLLFVCLRTTSCFCGHQYITTTQDQRNSFSLNYDKIKWNQWIPWIL